jgi:hypothetical protein
LAGIVLKSGNGDVIAETIIEKRRQPAGGRLVAGQAGNDSAQARPFDARTGGCFLAGK